MIKAIGKFISGCWALTIGLWTTLKHVFRKPVTIQYGYAPRWSKTETRPIAPRYRGRFVLVRDPESHELRCTGCGICAQACPGRCIEVTAENKKVATYQLDLDKCLFCGLCVEACPFEALGMMQEGAPGQRDHEQLRVTIPWLAQPEEAPMPGVLPSMAGGMLRPGKKPYAPKVKKAEEGEAKAEAGA
ncbi:MAG: NuoI/complex I 23 kDa subunit family protein [Armatimonadota bacterium]